MSDKFAARLLAIINQCSKKFEENSVRHNGDDTFVEENYQILKGWWLPNCILKI